MLSGQSKLTLFVILVTGIMVITRSEALVLLAVVIALIRASLLPPFSAYVGASLIGLYLLAVAEKERKPALLRIIAPGLLVGAVCSQFPDALPAIVLLVVSGAIVGLFLALKRGGHLKILSNPMECLADELLDNQYRFALSCVFYLSVLHPCWEYLSQQYSFGIGAVFYIAASLLALPALLDLLGQTTLELDQLVSLRSQGEQLRLEIRNEEKCLESVQASANALQNDYEERLEELEAELDRRKQGFRRSSTKNLPSDRRKRTTQSPTRSAQQKRFSIRCPSTASPSIFPLRKK